VADAYALALELTTRDLENGRTLIAGDVNRGKTTLTRELAGRLAAALGAGRLAVLDLAPRVPGERGADSAGTPSGVGGRLELAAPGALVLAPELAAPRLTAMRLPVAGREAEAERLARANLARIQPLLGDFAASGRDVLVVNDLSMFFQAAGVEDFLARIGTARTVLANGYLGESLGRTQGTAQGAGQGAERFSEREQRRMRAFAACCDRVVQL
jgi:hypothetical protein